MHQKLKISYLDISRYDSDNDGVVTVKEVSLVFRSIGYNPTEAELQVSVKKMVFVCEFS